VRKHQPPDVILHLTKAQARALLSAASLGKSFLSNSSVDFSSDLDEPLRLLLEKIGAAK
jgi:hypothetical protein